MARYAVQTVFSAIDGMTAPLARMTAGVRGFGGIAHSINNKIKGDLKAADAKLDAIGGAVKGALATAALAGAAAVSAGIVVATKQYVEFEASLRSAGAAFGDFAEIQKSGGTSAVEAALKGLGAEARAVAAATEFDAKMTADALATMAKAGLSSEQALAMLAGTADVATAAGVNLDEAVGMLVGGLNVMDMMSADAEVLQSNMKRMSDMMAYTADSANMSIEDVSEAVKAGGNFFHSANNDLDTFSASLTALANAQITGGEAGTHLRNIMTNLSAPTAVAAKTLAALGVQTADSQGNMLSLTDIVGQFRAGLAGMGDAEVNAALYSVFGKQNIAAFNALLAAGEDGLRRYAAASRDAGNAVNSMGDAVGAAAAKAEKIRMSIANQLEVLKSELTEMGFQFVESFQNPFVAGIRRVNAAIARMNDERGADGLTQMQRIGQSFAPVADALAGALEGFLSVLPGLVEWLGRAAVVLSGVVGFLWNFRGLIGPIAAALAVYKAEIMGVALATKVAGALGLAFSAATGAQTAAIAALVGLIVAVATHLDEIKAALARVGEDFAAFGAGVAAIFSYLWQAASGFARWLRDGVAGAFGALAGAAASAAAGIAAGMRSIGASILQFLLAPIQSVLGLLAKIPVVGGAFAGISGALDGAVGAVRGGGAAGAASAPSVAPVTSAQQNAYSRSESVQTSRVNLTLDDRLAVRGGESAPGVTISRSRSGAF